jgi:hypothetical protein
MDLRKMCELGKQEEFYEALRITAFGEDFLDLLHVVELHGQSHSLRQLFELDEQSQ